MADHGGGPGPPGQPLGRPLPDWVPPAPARPRALDGSTVLLRPLALADAEELFEAIGGPRCDPGLFTYLMAEPPADLEAMRAVIADALAAPSSWPLAIVVDGGAVGMASYLRTDPQNGSIEVGNILYSPALQRTTAATEAMHLMAEHAFAEGYRRYEWKCDSLNAPSRRAAARLGFVEEGTFRQAVVYKGRNRDTTWFSITDHEWPSVQEAQRRWLADAVAGAPGRLAGYYRD